MKLYKVKYGGVTASLKPGRFRFAALLLGIALFAACDIVQEPYMEKRDDGGETTPNPQKVLLLDFTGHTCKSCPKAHRTIEQLRELYGDRLVPVAFHLGYFSKPQTTGKFTTDFRTAEGALLEKHFDFVSFPTGTVQTFNNEQLQPYSAWPSLVSAGITGDAPVRIGIVPGYLSGLNAATAQVTVTATEALTGSLNLAVYLVEDSIVDWQKDEDYDPMDIPDYVHNHVFRTSFSGLWGEQAGTAEGMEEGFTATSQYSKLMNAAWKPEHCRIVAFILRNDTREVIQVESVAVMK